jgi:hypothetical protein
MTPDESRDIYTHTYSYQFANHIFGCDEALSLPQAEGLPLVTAAELYNLLRIDNSILIIPPFKMEKHKLIYVNPRPLKIDINILPAEISGIIVVHNFQVEDCNANLQECLAGIYFAGLINGRWEQPENFPVECRTIEIIAHLDRQAGKIIPL